MEFNKTELTDLEYLLTKIVASKPFYALEISKAKYLRDRATELISQLEASKN